MAPWHERLKGTQTQGVKKDEMLISFRVHGGMMTLQNHIHL